MNKAYQDICKEEDERIYKEIEKIVAEEKAFEKFRFFDPNPGLLRSLLCLFEHSWYYPDNMAGPVARICEWCGREEHLYSNFDKKKNREIRKWKKSSRTLLSKKEENLLNIMHSCPMCEHELQFSGKKLVCPICRIKIDIKPF